MEDTLATKPMPAELSDAVAADEGAGEATGILDLKAMGESSEITMLRLCE